MQLQLPGRRSKSNSCSSPSIESASAYSHLLGPATGRIVRREMRLVSISGCVLNMKAPLHADIASARVRKNETSRANSISHSIMPNTHPSLAAMATSWSKPSYQLVFQRRKTSRGQHQTLHLEESWQPGREQKAKSSKQRGEKVRIQAQDQFSVSPCPHHTHHFISTLAQQFRQ